jgi:hypothetical protein
MGSVKEYKVGTVIDLGHQAFIRRCIECHNIYGYTIDGEKTECDTSSNTCLQLCLAGVKDSHGLCEDCVYRIRVEFKRLRNPVMVQKCA